MLTQKELKKYLIYYPETGVFIRKINSGTAKKGDLAGSITKRNCIVISINNKQLKAHRLAFLYMNGEWPKCEVDHIDGDPLNNAWNNLRDVTHKENGRNQKTPKNNTSGYCGVIWDKEKNKWCSQITVDRKKVFLGYFINKQDAINARKKAEKKYRFHHNHGRSINININVNV